jgi:hypothetical protein
MFSWIGTLIRFPTGFCAIFAKSSRLKSAHAAEAATTIAEKKVFALLFACPQRNSGWWRRFSPLVAIQHHNTAIALSELWMIWSPNAT